MVILVKKEEIFQLAKKYYQETKKVIASNKVPVSGKVYDESEIINLMDAVLDQPPPYGLLERLGASSVPVRFFAWVDQSKTDYFKAKSEAIRLVKAAFDEAGIEMPEPIYRVHLRESVPPPSETPTPPEVPTEEGDTAADSRIDMQVKEERAAEGPDLLDEEAPRE